MAAACCLMFTACNNNKQAEQPAENTEMQAEDHPCCHEMTEEQKAEMEACKKAAEDWQNWENLSEDRKVELLNDRKAKYDEMQEMKKAHIGVNSQEQLVDEIIAPEIRLPKPLNIGEGMSEYEVISHLKAIGAKNKQFRTYIVNNNFWT